MENITVVLLTAGVMCGIFGFVVILVARSMRKRFDGYLDVSQRDTSKVYQLDIRTDPDKLRKQKEIILRVRKVDDL